MCACKTLSLISEVLQNPSRAGKGREVLLALFLIKNCKQHSDGIYHFNTSSLLLFSCKRVFLEP